MKKIFFFCLILYIFSSSMETGAWAIDVDWMQTAVRVWYLGGVGSGMTSNAEEAYLFDAIEEDNVQVTRHSALDHWNSPNAPETASYSFSGMGPCWIHPQALQTVDMGDYWMGHEITMVVRSDYTIDMIPYHFLPANALFKLQPQREVVKLVYTIAGFSVGSAYFDSDTGLSFALFDIQRICHGLFCVKRNQLQFCQQNCLCRGRWSSYRIQIAS